MSAPALLGSLLNFRSLDRLAAGDSGLHRLDARAKLLVALGFIVSVMSHERHAVAALLPYLVYPLALLAAARLPPAFLLRRLALVLPLALLIGLPNPWFERQPLWAWGGLELSGGWLSLLSIVLRTLLAASAALLLVAVTGFPALCTAARALGLPQPLVVQLQFLYRYLTLLAEEALSLSRARELRADGRALALREGAALLGSLLLRSWSRAERIHGAMCARGYAGRLPDGHPPHFGAADWAWLLGWCGVFLLLRTQDPVQALGALALRLVGA